LVAQGEVGEIVVRGPNVMQGYFEDPIATDEVLDAEGWLRTGDLGRIEADGTLVVTDRLKDMFISGGFNCYPAEVESLLLSHPDIAEVAVVGVPDDRMGAAFVVLRYGAEFDEPSLRAWARESMSNYKVPRVWHVVPALPMTASGKVQKDALRNDRT
jgi:HIP---CoA ligase